MEVHNELHGIAFTHQSGDRVRSRHLLVSGGDAAAPDGARAWLIHQNHGPARSSSCSPLRAEPGPGRAQAMIRASNGGTLFVEELADLDTDTLREVPLRLVDARRPAPKRRHRAASSAAIGDDLQEPYRVGTESSGISSTGFNSMRLVVEPRVPHAKNLADVSRLARPTSASLPATCRSSARAHVRARWMNLIGAELSHEHDGRRGATYSSGACRRHRRLITSRRERAEEGRRRHGNLTAPIRRRLAGDFIMATGSRYSHRLRRAKNVEPVRG